MGFGIDGLQGGMSQRPVETEHHTKAKERNHESKEVRKADGDAKRERLERMEERRAQRQEARQKAEARRSERRGWKA